MTANEAPQVKGRRDKSKKVIVGKRDSDKDEVEPDDLKHDDVVELREVNGIECWVSLKKKYIYKYRSGTEEPPSSDASSSELKRYIAKKIGEHRKGESYFYD